MPEGNNLSGNPFEGETERDARPFELLSRMSGVLKTLRDTNIKEIVGDVPESSPRHIIALSHIVIFQPISVSDLAVHLHVSLATTSNLVSQLSNGGLVDRTEDPNDHRRTLVTLSKDKGTVAAQLIHQRMEPIIGGINKMGNDRFRMLCELLDELLEGIESNPRNPTVLDREVET